MHDLGTDARPIRRSGRASVPRSCRCTRRRGSDVEAELHHVAALHDVFLALHAFQTSRRGTVFQPARIMARPGHPLRQTRRDLPGQPHHRRQHGLADIYTKVHRTRPSPSTLEFEESWAAWIVPTSPSRVRSPVEDPDECFGGDAVERSDSQDRYRELIGLGESVGEGAADGEDLAGGFDVGDGTERGYGRRSRGCSVRGSSRHGPSCQYDRHGLILCVDHWSCWSWTQWVG
ncbi:hypothetical protein STSO111631_18355 [Stackebrandtia soli]